MNALLMVEGRQERQCQPTRLKANLEPNRKFDCANGEYHITFVVYYLLRLDSVCQYSEDSEEGLAIVSAVNRGVYCSQC